MTMSKDIKDFIHLYLGCQCQVKYFDIPAQLTGISYDDQQRQWWCYFENTEASYAKIEEVKPILRPLSDMTEEEAADVYTIERDRILHPPTDDHDISRRADFGWVVTRLDHIKIGLLIRFDGVCYKVINEGKKPTIEPAMNQPLIFHYLLSKHFDLFGLIESGLAIDKTKLNP